MASLQNISHLENCIAKTTGKKVLSSLPCQLYRQISPPVDHVYLYKLLQELWIARDPIHQIHQRSSQILIYHGHSQATCDGL